MVIVLSGCGLLLLRDTGFLQEVIVLSGCGLLLLRDTGFLRVKLLRDSATDAAVSGVCSSYLGRVSRVLLGLNSTADPHLKFSVSLLPAQATSADLMYTHQGTDSTQLFWSLAVSC